jgi:hypothetical protein
VGVARWLILDCFDDALVAHRVVDEAITPRDRVRRMDLAKSDLAE